MSNSSGPILLPSLGNGKKTAGFRNCHQKNAMTVIASTHWVRRGLMKFDGITTAFKARFVTIL
jgi:hypothetical protein